MSGSELDRVIDWYKGTVISRLDNQNIGSLIVLMQRPHQNDLSGHLPEKQWPSLTIPANATDPETYQLGVGAEDVYKRVAGEALHPALCSLTRLDEIRTEIGSNRFSAQYQQNPMPPEGNMIKTTWFEKRYAQAPDRLSIDRLVISCDPAAKPAERNDFTAIAVLGQCRRDIYLLDVLRGHWTATEIQERIWALHAHWNSDVTLIEDIGVGTGLISFLQRDHSYANIQGRKPEGHKEIRVSRHEALFELGLLKLPEMAPWQTESNVNFLHSRVAETMTRSMLSRKRLTTSPSKVIQLIRLHFTIARRSGMNPMTRLRRAPLIWGRFDIRGW